MLPIEHQNSEQHQDRADQGIDHELDRRVAAPRAAPDRDDEVHRDQHGFPEDKEEQEIERHEDAQHAGLQDQEKGVIFLETVLDRGPARQDRQEPDHRSQHHQQQSQPVDAEVVAGADAGDPACFLNELKILRSVKFKHEGQRYQEPNE